MAKIVFKNYEELGLWLKEKPSEWAQAIAMRSALRMLPLLLHAFQRQRVQASIKADLMHSVFRANFVSWVAVRHPETDFRQVGADAADEHAEFVLASATKLVKRKESNRAVATAQVAARVAFAAAGAASHPNSSGEHATQIAEAAYVGGISFGTIGLWESIATDAQLLEARDADGFHSTAALAARSLWLGPIPEWAAAAWSGLRFELLLQHSGWSHWCTWYERRLRGSRYGFPLESSAAAALDIRIATQPDDWWRRRSEAVNSDIAEWVEGARSGEQHELNVSGFILGLLAGREGPFTIGQIREAFSEANYDVIDKTMRGQLSRLASEGKIWRVATGVYQFPTVLSAGIAPEVSDKSTGAEHWVEPIVTLDDQPNGFSFKEADSQLVIAASGNETDVEAARDPVTRHLHAEATRRASDFAAVGGKLDNQIGWHGMGLAASRLAAILAQGPEATAARIAEAWADLVELGSFLEQDNAILSGASTFADALDAEMHRKLESLITIASPYVRRYPTAATLDMEAGAFKTGQDLLPQARLIIEGARQTGLLNNNDATTLTAILDAAERSDIQGGKARTLGVQSSRNIVGASAKTLAAAYVGAVLGAAAPNSLLIKNGVEFYLVSEKAVVEIVKDLPDHVGLAFKAMIDRLKTDPPVPPLPEPPRIETPIRRENENQVKKRSSKRQG